MMQTKQDCQRRREAKLQRQCDVSAYDEFDIYCAQATGRCDPRLTSRQVKGGGSLPSVNIEESADVCTSDVCTSDSTGCDHNLNIAVTSSSPSTRCVTGHDGQLGVTLSPLIQRSHSAGNDASFYALSPRTPSKNTTTRFFTSVKNKLEAYDENNCDTASQRSQYNTSLDVPAVSKCPSAPHSRSNSLKRKKVRDTCKQDVTLIQERTASMPVINNQHRRPSHLPLNATLLHPSSADSTDEWERVRNFMTSRKGIINCGDSFRRSNSSLRSAESWGSDDVVHPSGGSFHPGVGRMSDARPVPLHRVLIIGGPGVGKTTLAQQFITSDCLVNVELLGGELLSASLSVMTSDCLVNVELLGGELLSARLSVMMSDCLMHKLCTRCFSIFE